MTDFPARLVGRQPTPNSSKSTAGETLRPGQVIRGVAAGQSEDGMLRVRAGSQELLVRTAAQPAQGSAVTLTVLRGGPQPEFSLSQASPTAGSRAASLAGHPLNHGRVVTATVLGPAPGGLTKLKLMGATLLAESRVELTPGQSVKLVVQETEPQVVFSLAQGKATARLPQMLQAVFQGNQGLAAGLRTILQFDTAALPEAVRQAAVDVQEAAARFSADSPDPLRQAIEHAGLNLEARLAAWAAQVGGATPAARGLRPLILALERAMAAESGRAAAEDQRAAGLGEFVQTARQVGEFLDNLAGLNSELAPRDNQLLLALALAMDDQVESGELLLELPEPDEQGRREGETSLVFLLRLSSLGSLAIEARLASGTLRADFITDSLAKSQFIDQRLGQLREALADMGLAAHLRSRVRPARAVEEASPMADLIRRHGQYLSITV